MSLTALSTIAAQRDQAPPKRPKRNPQTADETDATEANNYASALVAAIPTEPLALYTFLTAGIVATIGPDDDQLLELRWTIYGVGIGYIVLWLGVAYYRERPSSARKRKFPWVETVTAVVAFAAWGLVMPESPLNAELTDTGTRTVWTLIITAVGAAILALLGNPLKSQAG
jgi:hypothetical protein